jgi:hypothetical protein
MDSRSSVEVIDGGRELKVVEKLNVKQLFDWFP